MCNTEDIIELERLTNQQGVSYLKVETKKSSKTAYIIRKGIEVRLSFFYTPRLEGYTEECFNYW